MSLKGGLFLTVKLKASIHLGEAVSFLQSQTEQALSAIEHHLLFALCLSYLLSIY